MKRLLAVGSDRFFLVAGVSFLARARKEIPEKTDPKDKTAADSPVLK